MDRVWVRIEVPRWGFIKRAPSGSVDFVSPAPTPFNYGSVLGVHTADDGEPPDALVLGPRLAWGSELEIRVRGVARFVDEGVRDDKLICKERPLSPFDCRSVIAFFMMYSAAKSAAARVRRAGAVRFEGLELQ